MNAHDQYYDQDRHTPETSPIKSYYEEGPDVYVRTHDGELCGPYESLDEAREDLRGADYPEQ
jgi:hypothetical protein